MQLRFLTKLTFLCLKNIYKIIFKINLSISIENRTFSTVVLHFHFYKV